MKARDHRVQRVQQVLKQLKIIKLLAWEPHFWKGIKQARQDEWIWLRRKKYLDAICVYFWATTPVLVSLLTFGIVAMEHQTLSARVVFTSLTLFQLLTLPLNALPWVVQGVIEARVSYQRLKQFLCQPLTPQRLSVQSLANHRGDIVFTQYSAAYQPLETLPNPVVQNISIAIESGQLIVIEGSVGSGKTSFLRACLNELYCVNGSVNINGSMAYVSQQPCTLFSDLKQMKSTHS